MNPALEFNSVTIRYPGSTHDIISNISLQIKKGERVALFGLNGSGKTTLFLAAAGLISFTGSICIDNIPVEKKNLQKVRDRLGFLFNIPEDQILFPRVLDDVAYGLIRKGVQQQTAHEKAKEILIALGAAMLSECSPFQLSHGQRQRIALAGAMITNPAVLLLDEPSSALDPVGKRSLANVLRSVDAAMLIATHDLDFASRTCDRYILLRDGNLFTGFDFQEAQEQLLGSVTS